MIKAILVDDEPLALQNLAVMIGKCMAGIEITATAATVNDAIRLMEQHKPDLVFLDIELAGRRSFEIVERQAERYFELIFVTAHDQFGIKALKQGALDYILKPINKAELAQAIEKAVKKIEARKTDKQALPVLTEERVKQTLTRLAVPTLNGLVFVDMNKIMYCESDGRYTKFYMAEESKKSMMASKNLGEYEAILPSHQFVRIHHHTIVNINFIERYIKGRGGYVVLSNGVNLAVSPARKSAFFDKLA